MATSGKPQDWRRPTAASCRLRPAATGCSSPRAGASASPWRCGSPEGCPTRTSTRRSRSPTRCAAAHHDAISSVDAANKVTRGTPDSVATFSIFATFPAPYFSSPVGPLIDQIIGTGLLVLVIFAVIDAFNTPVQATSRRSWSA